MKTGRHQNLPIGRSPELVQKTSKHTVPLSTLAVELLEQTQKLSINPDFAFPSPRGSKPILATSLSHALIRSSHLGINHFSAHDLRRTAATHMTGPNCKVSRFILERVLIHADQTVTGMP
jgi:integrase